MLWNRFLALLDRGTTETRFVFVVIIFTNIANLMRQAGDLGEERAVSWLSHVWIWVLWWNP
jgi:hypothetical protein